MVRAATLVLVAALRLSAQDAAVGVLLERVRAHMLATLAAQPNYTCLETVERATRAAREKDFRVEDVVKLEVALVDGKELFAWPGSKFQDTSMSTFVPTGMFGNGEFGLFTKTVFAGRSTKFEYRGPAKLGQISTQRFDFRVPMESGMRISVQDKMTQASYHGSFYAEPGTLDVLRLEVVADPLPKSLDLRDVTDSMDYARAHIGGSDFLLPSGSEAVMSSLRGDASRNRIGFSACHEFTGESKLKFGDDDAAAGPNAPAVKTEIQLPKNAEIEMQLLDDIDTGIAAVGDIVHAKVTSDVKAKKQVLLPKGTVATGRIVRLERFERFTVLGLMFEEAESEKAHAYLDLTFDSASGADQLGRGVPWGTRSPVRPHEGLVPLRPGRLRTGRGIIFVWRT